MTDLLKDLDALNAMIQRGKRGSYSYSYPPEELAVKAAGFVVDHHAEISANAKDAARWRALHWAEAPMVTVTGSQLARGIRPGDYAVPWDWPVISKTKIRLIVMRNSAQAEDHHD